MNGAHRAALALVLTLASAAPAQEALEGAFDKGDSSFSSGQSRSETKLDGPDAGARRGWTEIKQRVRFGRYALLTQQRLDPATGFPPEKQGWGDVFVGLEGQKPAVYMSSNWSPWNFLDARVTLAGDAEPLPSPARSGRAVYARLWEETPERLGAEAVFVDRAGGLLRARLTGWRDSTRFGLSLAYAPPAGREVAQLTYELVCQPYDIHEREEPLRERWLSTPSRALKLDAERPATLDPGAEFQAVFHNRQGQLTSGTLLACDAGSVGEVQAELRQKAIVVSIRPRSAGAPVVLALSDWVDRTYTLEARDFFAQAEAVKAELKRAAEWTLPAPPPPAPAEGAEALWLCAAHGDLAPAWRERTNAAWTALKDAHASAFPFLKPAQPVPDSPELLRARVGYVEAERAWATLWRELRRAWVREACWAQEP
ncbi:MAG: hypothetical protein M5U26_25040 [Planctomycetota bacterium]|nr:hypothetical protein [Planctomycetota bacterium]